MSVSAHKDGPAGSHSSPHGGAHGDDDAAQLRALGYVSHFDRSMSLWQNFALGFTYLSPVVGVYTIFATTFAAGGPPMWWTYLFVGLGQLLVCLIFGEIVSQFPISGGHLSLGAPIDRQALGLDGRLGVWLGAVHHGRGHRYGGRPLPGAAVRLRGHAGGYHPHRHRADRDRDAA